MVLRKCGHFYAPLSRVLFPISTPSYMRPPGHPTVFTPEEEELLVKTLRRVSDWGFPFAKSDIREVLHTNIWKKSEGI